MMQGDNNDEKKRTEVVEGALHDQPELSTQKFEMLKDADDKQDFESVGADGGETATLQTKCHQVHTLRQDPGSHGQETPSFAQDQGCGRFMRRNSFSGPESSTRRQTSCLIRR